MTITAEAPVTAIDALVNHPADFAVHDLDAEIDRLDNEILARVRKRVEVARLAGQARVDSGLPQVTRKSEIETLRRFERYLGRDGVSLAMVLLRLGRKGASGN